MTLEVAFYYLFSYIIGSIPSGFILSYLIRKEDIRSVGSGNIGATNVFRCVGKKSGVLTFICDFIKGVIPSAYGILNFENSPEIAMVGGGLAILGHVFPVFLKFRGGKGVATYIGAFLIFSGWSIPVFIITFVLTLYISKYVSVASVTAVIAVFFYITFTEIVEVSIFALIITVVITIKHKTNFKRIGLQEEPRVGVTK